MNVENKTMTEIKAMSQPLQWYGLSLGDPWNSQLLLTGAAWQLSPLGQLNADNVNVWLEPMTRAQAVDFTHAWQLVGAYWRIEDELMTHFNAFDEFGTFRGEAHFGVSWASADNVVSIGGAHWTPNQSAYYIPKPNVFYTPNTGGYEVTVLEDLHPSETMHFALDKSSKESPHRTLIINFQLLPIGQNYKYK